MLPLGGRCVTTQRQFQELCRGIDLASYGITATPVDLLVPDGALRSRGKRAHFHVWSRPLPQRSMFRLEESLLVSSPELVVVQIVSSQAKLDSVLDGFARESRAQRDALARLGIDEKAVAERPTGWEKDRRIILAARLTCEFAGSYRLPTGERKEVCYHAPALMSVADVHRMVREASAQFVAHSINVVADLAFDGSASPMETALALMLTMPVALGGFGLPKPRLNVRVDVANQVGALSDRDELTPDMLWERERVVLEYDSVAFHADAGAHRLAEDAVRSNILTAMGYRVLRVTPENVRSLVRLELLARQLACCLGVSLEEPSEVELHRRGKVFAELMPGYVSRRSEV